MNRQQIEWSFNNVERLTNKYLGIFPFTDKDWEDLVADVKKVSQDSKEHPEVVKLCVTVLNYFEELDAIYRRVSG